MEIARRRRGSNGCSIGRIRRRERERKKEREKEREEERRKKEREKERKIKREKWEGGRLAASWRQICLWHEEEKRSTKGGYPLSWWVARPTENV